ncbi:MAG: hypothetical protein AAF585_17845, partial [Verrucomicrobiota bacterium]
KKWKVWWLTTFGLWLVIFFTNATVGDHYFEQYGIRGAHPKAQSAVLAVVNTFLNSSCGMSWGVSGPSYVWPSSATS